MVVSLFSETLKNAAKQIPTPARRILSNLSLYALSRSRYNLSSLPQPSLIMTPALKASEMKQSTGVFWGKHMAPEALKMTE